jgi:phenylalanine-4-hydroxylase
MYWHTLEFGAVAERSGAQAFGAGLLSSCTEIRRLADDAHLADWDLDRIAATPYDPTDLQPCYFVAPSFTRLVGDLLDWLHDGAWRVRSPAVR